MALDAGIEMSACRLHREGGRAHFMTTRFDRTDSGDKLHMQSLCAMMHFDFNQPDAWSYEQALQTIRRIGMPTADVEQQFRRAVFNVMARNHDDHVKNIAYLMTQSGEWRLSPAFDVAYSYNPSGAWTSRHQMSINGKRDGFELADLLALASAGSIKPKRALDIVDDVAASLERWFEFADGADVDAETAERIRKTHRALS
jgi:serine/threonine-protein kinase HipA